MRSGIHSQNAFDHDQLFKGQIPILWYYLKTMSDGKNEFEFYMHVYEDDGSKYSLTALILVAYMCMHLRLWMEAWFKVLYVWRGW